METSECASVTLAACRSVLGRARSLITPDKRGRSFAAEVPAGQAATVLERLIAFTGREP